MVVWDAQAGVETRCEAVVLECREYSGLGDGEEEMRSGVLFISLVEEMERGKRLSWVLRVSTEELIVGPLGRSNAVSLAR